MLGQLQTPALNAAVVATLQQLMQFQERALDREASGGGAGGAGASGSSSAGGMGGKTLAAKKKRVVWHSDDKTVDSTASKSARCLSECLVAL